MASLGFSALQYDPGYRDDKGSFHPTTNTVYFDEGEVPVIRPTPEIKAAGFPWWIILVLGGVYLSQKG